MTTPTPATVHGTPPHTNPDTDGPMPTACARELALVDELLAALRPSARQLALVDELLAALRPGAGDVFYTESGIEQVRAALTAAVVRQHGRTLRSCIAELRDMAAENEREARALVAELPTEGGTITGRIASAHTLARAALTLTIAAPRLQGDR